MAFTFRTSKRRRRLIEAMVLLRDRPLVLVMCFANFLTNIIALGPMPPVVKNHSGAKVPLPCSTSNTIVVGLEDGSMVGSTPNHLRAQFTSEKVERLRVKIERVMKDLPEEMCELVLRHQDRGASFWLEALPLQESDFVLSKFGIAQIHQTSPVSYIF